MKKIHRERHIYALLDGRLSDGQKAKLEKHLDECKDCREFMQQVGTLRSELKRLGEAELKDTGRQASWNVIEAGIHKGAVRQEEGAPQTGFGAFFWKLSFVTAAILLMFALYIVHEKFTADEDEDIKTALSVDEKAGEDETVLTAESLNPLTGRVTFTSKNVKWSMKGVSPKDLDIETVLREGARVNVPSGSAAGIQVGGSGIRVEPLSTVTFARLTEREIKLRLHSGTVSVDLSTGEKKTDLCVITDEARVSVKGTLFSVSRQNHETSVVVGRGIVLVTPEKNEKNSVHVKRSEGMRVSAKGNVSTMAGCGIEPETQRLEKALFNVFRDQIPEEVLTVDIESDGKLAYINIDGKAETSMQITMKRAAGAGEVKLVMKNGSEVPLSFSLAKGKTASITYDISTLSKLDIPEPESRKLKKQTPEPKEKLTAEKGPEEETEEEETGFVDPLIIKMKIFKHKGQMRSCYEKYLATSPEEIKIKARVAFTIGTSGKVTQASCKCNVDNKNLKNCLMEVIKSIAFPQPEGGPAKFEYPVSFTPK